MRGFYENLSLRLCSCGSWHAVHRLVVFWIKALETFRANAMSKISIRMFLDISLDLLPIPVIIPDLFAGGANGQQTAEGLDLLERVLEFLDQLEPFLFLAFALRHIARDGRSADYLPSGIFDGRDRQGDVDRLAIFAQAHSFKGFNRFAPSHQLQSFLPILRTIGWDEHDSRLADDLARRITIQSLGGSIPTGHHADEGLADNSVFARLDDKSQMCPRGLDLAAAAAFLGGAQFTIHRNRQPRQIVLHHVIMRAGFHHLDGYILPDRTGN